MLDNSTLQEKLSQIEKISAYESKQIGALIRIFNLKRKADSDYIVALEAINTETNRYLESQPGFLNQMVKSFQSLLAITHTHQLALLEGYDNQVLKPLSLARDRQIDQSIVKKVMFAQGKVSNHIAYIKEKIHKLKWVDDEIQMHKSEAKIKDRMGGMTESETMQHAGKLKEIFNAKKEAQEALEKGITELESLSQLYDQTKTDLVDYQNHYFTGMNDSVIDNVMRLFVLEVAFIKCVENDIASILKRLKDNRDECKKSSIEEVKSAIKNVNTTNIKSFLWDTYKNMTKGQFNFNQPFVHQSLKNRLQHLFNHFKIPV